MPDLTSVWRHGKIERLNVVGPYRGPSGYDRHTRELVRGLAALGLELGLEHLDGWSTPMPPEWHDPWFASLPPTVAADTVLHFTMPSQLRPRPGVRNVNYTMFEAERIPAAWVDAAANCDLVLVPTHAALTAWTTSGVPADRVRVSPLGVDGTFFAEPSSPLPIVLRDGRPVSGFGTRFLHVGELRPRKNQIGLLRAWITATVPDDDAVLILKCPQVRHMVVQLAADVEALKHELGRGLADAAPVHLAPSLFTDEQMRGLYAAATHYMSMSRGEGWDQVMMEVAVCGLHLIAPAHTAYLEYLDDGDAEFIPCELGPATFEGAIGPEDERFFDALRWWHPDERVAVDIIRGAIDGTRARHAPPAARLSSTYTWQAAAQRLVEALTG
jgi:glycosyltransferase involved in cell wall biosynthesis